MLEAGGWTGDNDADADRRMPGGSGQASARREGRQEEGRRGAGPLWHIYPTILFLGM